MPPIVLVVEDDVAVRETLRELLTDSGLRVVCARNGADALDELFRAAVAPTLILLDLMMPIMDGYEFRARQLADARLRDIPVVVITAHEDAQRTSRALGAPVLVKPFDVDELYAHIDAIVSVADAAQPTV